MVRKLITAVLTEQQLKALRAVPFIQRNKIIQDRLNEKQRQKVIKLRIEEKRRKFIF